MNMNGMNFSAFPPMNPSPYQYPAPSQFGQQGIMQQSQSQPQTQQPGPDWVRVATAQQVEQVSVQPGSKAWVMVENVPIFALRVADNMGLVTTDYYRFEKIDQNTATGNGSASANSVNGITREEAEILIDERLNAFADGLKTSHKAKKVEASE